MESGIFSKKKPRENAYPNPASVSLANLILSLSLSKSIVDSFSNLKLSQERCLSIAVWFPCGPEKLGMLVSLHRVNLKGQVGVLFLDSPTYICIF